MDLDAFPTLTDAQRVQARRNAERNLVAKYAKMPRREDFNDYTVSEYPRWFVLLVASGLIFVALSAGVISAFRLYHAGYTQFYQDIPNETQARAVGVLTPLAAEVLVIMAAIAMQIYAHRRGAARWIAAVPVITGTVVAFVGNWQITQPDNTWSWVETIFPPVAVLSVAFFFELTTVPEMNRRRANENAYRDARATYDRMVNHPEKHTTWRDTYGWALWEMWQKVYSNSVAANEIDRELRQQIALREMSADNFFSDDMQLNAMNAGGLVASDGRSKKQVVLDFLLEHPEAISEDQTALAAILTHATGMQISQSTVSRAVQRFSQNGHGE